MCSTPQTVHLSPRDVPALDLPRCAFRPFPEIPVMHTFVHFSEETHGARRRCFSEDLSSLRAPAEEEVESETEEPRWWMMSEDEQEVEAKSSGKSRNARRKAAKVARESKDTTLMIQNLPYGLTAQGVYALMGRFQRSVDFLYVPIDFKTRSNLGYAFVNIVCAEEAAEVRRTMNEMEVSDGSSTKKLQVSSARVQGVAENVNKFRNSSVMRCLSEEEKPMLFANGVRVPFPKADRVRRFGKRFNPLQS